MTEQERAAIAAAMKVLLPWQTSYKFCDKAIDLLRPLLTAPAASPEPQPELPDDEAVLKEVLVEIGRRFPSAPLALVRATVYRTLGIVGRSALASRPDPLAEVEDRIGMLLNKDGGDSYYDGVRDALAALRAD